MSFSSLFLFLGSGAYIVGTILIFSAAFLGYYQQYLFACIMEQREGELGKKYKKNFIRALYFMGSGLALYVLSVVLSLCSVSFVVQPQMKIPPIPVSMEDNPANNNSEEQEDHVGA